MATPKPNQPSTSKGDAKTADLTAGKSGEDEASVNVLNLPALLDRLELRLSEKISQSTDPIREQLHEIQSSLRITSQTAEKALKMGASLKADITDILMPNVELKVVRAFRLGSLTNPRRRNPRDILLQLGDWDSWQRFLTTARNKGFLPFNDRQVLVFPDIPQEALMIRNKLAATTQRLRSAKIKYRWLQTGQIQVFYQGKSLTAKDEDSGLQLLQELNLTEESDLRRSQKRKHMTTSTPEKVTKIPIREDSTPESEDIADEPLDN
ncbi:UNVERIFIED_CONTAM: hypothetical protein K2H54_006699 [Gekko kuhli]